MGRPEQKLGYKTGKRSVQHLPEWAQYLVRLGRHAVDHDVPNRRLVVGVTVPTRAFAAAFAALGVADAAYQDPEKRDPRQNFERIAGLPAGTPIRFRRGRFLYSGQLLGTEVVGGVEHLTYHDGTKCYLPWDRCGSVEPLDPAEQFVRRRQLAPNARFVEAALEVDPLAHASTTCLDCLVVGVKDALRTDIVDEQFTVTTDDDIEVTGVLNDLLRCDAFELNANDHDRTAVVSGFLDEVPERLQRERPPVVVFDGPQGYLRLRSHWRRSPWIVLLDRTAPAFASAGDCFNQELALSVDDADLSALGEPPQEFEVCAYYEAVR